MSHWRFVLVISICVAWALSGSVVAGDLLSKGLEAQKAGKNDQAVELLGKYLKDHPDAAEARRVLALALAALDRRTEALAALAPALARNPKDVGLLLAQGKILAEMDRIPEAIAIYGKVLSLDPKNAAAFKERGECLAQEGRFEEALKDYAQAAALAPQDPWVFQKRGMVYFCQGKYREAVAEFSTAIKLAPDSPLFYFCRAQIYLLHLNQKKEAVADLQEGCRLGHSLCCGELEKMGIEPKKK